MLPDLNARGSTAASTADTWASVELLAATDPRWLEAVLADFPAFLRDHASCEKKASGMALAMAAHYPDRPVLLAAMADLAAEELGHYREVVRLLVERDLQPGADVRDPYVNALNAEVRRGSMEYLLDRLLVGAVVDAGARNASGSWPTHTRSRGCGSSTAPSPRARGGTGRRSWHSPSTSVPTRMSGRA